MDGAESNHSEGGNTGRQRQMAHVPAHMRNPV